jgi:DNA-directed RNA polymerase subunit omega
MARISVQQAVENMNGNQFDLIMVAAKRARDLQRGAEALTDRPGSSAALTALREIEEGAIQYEYLYTPELEKPY